ncbi:DNA-damage-inducible protein F [Afipia carboxidovorans OM5]|uniref:Multidrug resistance pump, MATE efflux family protein MatE n=1 Tax=Afipia carboxidovorans (strain ATCC 49405 / DSM 1227 / KCTC 32145 / OM5) TaxID=504832 RepID=B6JDA4_AFIC5|nr:MATE family efflux transporter [Afipia carboxidovorans]ACI91815.1 DNA-damage-inducible protein F [Afipia carboxidovorans OM5]AEI04320.1 multidrug resistance pump, MATE efflux family protein MatE [Afipia carboxidovorans OM4]AEI07950.1 multidrug resistance pump, MATE efflux family protein MatE [Afipia carboxidovorans OM5]BEV45381.1 MATE family efflux transporter [Afipia carboxidovorans]
MNELTHGRVFAIAGPAMLANLTTPLLGVVATGVIGQLGEAHLLGGVAMASVVFDCLFWLFAFLRMSTAALTAQALGARVALEVRATLARGLLIAIVSSVVLLILQKPLSTLAFDLMGGSRETTEAARLYFSVRLWSAPFLLGNFVLLGWLIGQARTGLALAIQIAINLINIVATVTLVIELNQGVTGAAYAAILAEGCGLILGLWVARRILGPHALRLSRAVVLDRAKLSRMMAINRDIMIRTAAVTGAFLFFTAQGARSGDVVLAANAVLNNFAVIGSFFLDGLATAAEQLSGYSVGARDRRNFQRATKLVLGWSAIAAAAVTLILLVGGGPLIDLMTTSADVRIAAREYMWLAALAPVCGVMAYAFDGIYIGATWARDMRNLMLLSLALYFAAWALLLPLGNTGLWLSLLIFLLARGGFQALRYPKLFEASFARPLTPATLPQ